MSQDSEADSATILRLARYFPNITKHQQDRTEVRDPALDANSEEITTGKISHEICRPQFHTEASEEEDQGFIVCQDAHTGERDYGTDDDQFTNPFTSDAISNCDPVSEFMRSIGRSDSMSPSDPPELYLPGLVIHIVPQRSNFDMRIWKRWGVPEKTQCHKAYIADRESFKDMIVSPSMSQVRNTQVLPSEPPMV